MVLTGTRLISQIIIGNRVRTDETTNVDALAKSIKERGLINAVIIDGHGELISGWRRLRAQEALGIKSVPVLIVTTFEDQNIALVTERQNVIEHEAMNPVDVVNYATRLAVLYNKSARSLANLKQYRNREGYGPAASDTPRRTVRDEIAPHLGMSPSTAGRYLALGRALASEDPAVKTAADEALAEIRSGRGVEASVVAMRRKVEDGGTVAPTSREETAALSMKIRRREELVSAKFQHEIIGQALETATSLVAVLTHIADKLTTYGVNPDIPPSEQQRWLKDIARTKSALNKVSRVIKGGHTPC